MGYKKVGSYHIQGRFDKNEKNALIIDISCDKNGGIETSIPTTIESPIYYINGVAHYVVDHTPSIFYKTISKSLSKMVAPYVDMLLTEKYDDILKNALSIKDGEIIDKRIIEFQKR